MALLDVENLSIAFGGVKAVQNVSFSVDPGIVYSVIGPNGAGKTTLFNVLTGLYRHDEGQFRFQGRALEEATPDRIAALGIARTFQNIRLFANLSALENVMIGRHVRTRAGVFGAMLRDARTRREEREIEKRRMELRAANAQQKEYLRWKHEATVVEVVERIDGQKYVLTFETGQIGVVLRRLSDLGRAGSAHRIHRHVPVHHQGMALRLFPGEPAAGHPPGIHNA